MGKGMLRNWQRPGVGRGGEDRKEGWGVGGEMAMGRGRLGGGMGTGRLGGGNREGEKGQEGGFHRFI